MLALFRAEVGRALSRRLFLILLLVVVGVIAVAGLITFFTTEEPARGRDSGLVLDRAQVRECIQTGAGLPPGTAPEERSSLCRQLGIRHAPALSPERGFELSSLPGIFLGTSSVAVILAWLVGASFIGAEWHSGNLTTVLTWEPRRVRLFAVKLLACLAVLSVALVVLHSLLGLALAPTAALRGSTSGVDWEETIAVVLRVVALADIAAVLGFALAAIGRNTAAALGVGFAYLAIVETLVRAWKPAWSRWLIADNAILFVSGEVTVFETGKRDLVEAGLVLLCYSLGSFLVATALFHKRDVT